MTGKALVSSAVRLRLVLFIIMGLFATGITALAVFGLGTLRGQAAEVQQVVYDAENSNQKLQRVQELTSELTRNQEAVSRAKQIVAESKSYQYQDVIIRDLQAMANLAGVNITNFNFNAGAANTNGTAAPSDTPAATPTPTLSSGLRSTNVSITLQTPVSYRNLLTFIHYVEQNLTKMQISKVGISSASNNQSGNTVSTDALTIEVYIR